MKKDDHIKLGFTSHKELVTFYDVCIDLCRYNHEKEKGEVKSYFTKDECLDIINRYNLMDLLNDVKDLYSYDKMINIFLYYHNCLATYQACFDIYSNKVLDSIDKEDGAELILNCCTLEDINNQMAAYVFCLKETVKRICNRFNEEELTSFNKLLSDMGFNDDRLKL